MRRQLKCPFAPLCAAAVLAAACSDGPAAPRSMHVDSAGIDIARYAGPDAALDWTFEPALELGGKETEAESFYRVAPGLADVDSAGNIYVLDGGAARVRVFDPTGQPVRSLGGQGGGPGEFRFALGFAVTPDGTVGVADMGKRALVRFGPGGEILPERPLPASYLGGDLHLAGDALMLPRMVADSAGTPLEVLDRVTPADTVRIVARVRTPGGPIRLESCGMGFTGMPPLFTPTLRWSAAGAFVAVATTAEYEIRVIRDGTLMRIVRRDIAPVPATPEAAVRDLGEGMTVRTEGGVRRCSGEELVEKRGVAPVIPAIARVAIDPAGRLWVERGHVRGDPAPIDIFDENGDYAGTLPPGSPFPILFVGPDRIGTVATDSLDVSRLVITDVRPAT